uniref:Uncharacterized protein n=1 Tax=Dromaius novaehollandiae TaxID=8790 RepID=A0A8C4K8I2_DRONO
AMPSRLLTKLCGSVDAPIIVNSTWMVGDQGESHLIAPNVVLGFAVSLQHRHFAEYLLVPEKNLNKMKIRMDNFKSSMA